MTNYSSQHRDFLTPEVIFTTSIFKSNFDLKLFEFHEKEIAIIDPQQRILLILCHPILKRDQNGKRNESSKSVFVGISTSEYSDLTPRSLNELGSAYSATASALSVASGRVSFCFDLRGPSMSIDTACSSSLVAMHLGAKSCNQDECSASLVCGVNLILLSRTTEIFQRAGMLSRDGRCKTLDSTADGYVRSEGCEVLHLIRGYDGLHTVIVSGSAVNQDGRSSSLTAPNGPSQRVVIETALENACADACSLSKFYMHGTGTSLGDPIEIGGILSVVGHFDRMKFSISAVKTYFGHSECASGISSILCAVQQLEYSHRYDTTIISQNVSIHETEIQRFRELTWRENCTTYGIIHTAGILRDASIFRQSPEIVRAVFAPKVVGYKNIINPINANLFTIAFSSITAQIPSIGQANYSSANATLDVLVTKNFTSGLPVCSIRWGAWDIYEIVSQAVFGTIGKDVGAEQPLMEAGIDSLVASELANTLSTLLNIFIPTTIAFDYPTKWNTENMPSISARFGSFINNIEMFDASIFSINSVEAQMMDPQQRLLLMEVLNSKACVKKLTDCSEILPEVGVYIGITSNYFNISFVTKFTHYSATGQQPSVASGRLSYIFGWIGPALSIDTACSSSLVGVHQGFIYCNTAEYTTRKKAVCSGCHIITSQWSTMLCDAAGMLSTDGRCKALDDRADGYVRGEAIEILTIERKENVMKSSCVMTTTVNQDGRSSALTAPNGYAQYSIIKESLNSICTDAKVAINGAELHGTGTVLGDPIELGSIQKAILHYGKKNEAIVLSAIKSLLGHGETGAGITSLLCGLKKTFKLQNIGNFDREYFGLSTIECKVTDPQQRLILQYAQMCFLSVNLSNCIRAKFGVFIAISQFEYGFSLLQTEKYLPTSFAIGNSHSVSSGRISFFFDFKGPSISVDTACSSSHVALHLLRNSLLKFETSAGISGSVNLCLNRKLNMVFSESGMLSVDGRCKVLDASADGYVRQEFCGVIFAVSGTKNNSELVKPQIGKTVMNQDGLSSSLTAPNGSSQRALIGEVLRAEYMNITLQGVHIHGTGTPLGDPIEINALSDVMDCKKARKLIPLNLSAIKSSLGHAEVAAGMISIISLISELELDAMIDKQNVQSFNSIMNSKVYLFYPYINDDCRGVDRFTLCSSIVSLLGSSGQSNYAAANSWLDTYSNYRSYLGINTISIQWGAWCCQQSMATFKVCARMIRLGLGVISSKVGLIALNKILSTTTFPSLIENGVDSLAAVEISNLIGAEFGVTLPVARAPYRCWDTFSNVPMNEGALKAVWGAFLHYHVDHLDNSFFQIPVIELNFMDNQQRLLLFDVAECIPHPIQSVLMQNTDIGVFVGISSSDHARMLNIQIDDISPFAASGGAFSVAAGRLSFCFALSGPSIAVDTACSSSLVALHVCIGISSTTCECKGNIVTGVNLIQLLDTTLIFVSAGMISKDGRCKVLDQSADGYVRSESCSSIFMQKDISKPNIYTNIDMYVAISGSCVNQDGRSSSLNAPSGLAQRDCIKHVIHMSRHMNKSDENTPIFSLHGTGTALGDPIETSAIQKILYEEFLDGVKTCNRPMNRFVHLAATKSRLGHSEPASGILSVVHAIGGLSRIAQLVFYSGVQNHDFYHYELISRNAQKNTAYFTSSKCCISVQKVDVAMKADSYDSYQRTYATLDVLTHAAGSLCDALAYNQSINTFSQVLSPKVKGLSTVSSWLSTIPIKKLIIFSSISSTLGIMSQSNYAAANGWMDSWSCRNYSSGLNVISIEWGAWNITGGMANNSVLKNSESVGVGSLAPIDALNFFRMTISSKIIPPLVLAFHITEMECSSIDPQHRILLEVVQNARAQASMLLSQSGKDGVIVGISSNEFCQISTMVPKSLKATGGFLSVACGRISYVYNFTGPSMCIDTACSSSLVSLHLSNRTLTKLLIRIFSGGVNITLLQSTSSMFASAGMLSSDGRCKVLDALADGYVRSEECIIALLANFQEKDHIVIEVKGSAVSQDGRSSSLTAPNGPSQKDCINMAIADISEKVEVLEFFTFDLLQLHGTGTALGDPIEFGALHGLNNVTSKNEPLVVSASKSRSGHKEPASGLFGLVNAIEQCKNRKLYDGLLNRQNCASLRVTNAPKIDSMMHLVSFIRLFPLSIITMSSISSLLVSPGQLNYAASNKYMNSWVYKINVQGIVGLSIKFGAWNGIEGMATKSTISRLEKGGSREMDPQQRILLESCLKYFTSSRKTVGYFQGYQIGIYLGVMWTEYQHLLRFINPDRKSIYLGTGNGLSFLLGRPSFVFGLNGPSCITDTACSSSLVALHLSQHALMSAECIEAFVGGIQCMILAETFMIMNNLKALSSDSRCKTLDVSANGYGRGEGTTLLYLGSYDEESLQWHIIRIRGSSVNQDGRSSSFTSPYGPSQQNLIKDALKKSNLNYVAGLISLHGTGTSLGDPIEVSALKEVCHKDSSQYLTFASSKSFFGHTEGAAGLTGLILACASIFHSACPEMRFCRNLNPHMIPNIRGFISDLTPIPLRNQDIFRHSKELRIAVKAVGLNFRDILNVLGMYPGDPGNPGSDFSGTVLTNQSSFKIGESVFGLSAGCLGTIVEVLQTNCAHKPPNISHASAAALPTAMITADLILEKLNNLDPIQEISHNLDRTVLLHGASGGVGLTTAQLLISNGYTVIGSASSARKRFLMRTLGFNKMTCTRTTDFVDSVTTNTLGVGVHSVINSLTSPGMIAASLSVLQRNGSFIEIGKREIWSPRAANLEKPTCEINLIATDFLSPRDIEARMHYLSCALCIGTMKPIPSQINNFNAVRESMREMAHANHIGKIIVTKASFKENLSLKLLIFGGLGYLGRLMTMWSNINQVRKVSLLSRLARFRKIQPNLFCTTALMGISKCKIESFEEVRQISSIHRSFGNTIVNASGLLRDGTIELQSFNTISIVITPKCSGMHRVIKSFESRAPIQNYIFFSSIATFLASPGQINYVAVNASLDNHARTIQIRGHACVSIQWGGWEGDGGMANSVQIVKMKRSGIGSINPMIGLRLLDITIASLECTISPNTECLSIINPFDWSTDLPCVATRSNINGSTATDTIISCI
ncbi:unnamed protein product [Bathycoccus prasinos]